MALVTRFVLAQCTERNENHNVTLNNRHNISTWLAVGLLLNNFLRSL